MEKLKRIELRESYQRASVAQVEEQLAFNQTCAGSIPAGGIDGCNPLRAIYLLWQRDREEYERQIRSWSRRQPRWLN